MSDKKLKSVALNKIHRDLIVDALYVMIKEVNLESAEEQMCHDIIKRMQESPNDNAIEDAD